MIFCIGDGQYESKGIGYQKNLMMFNKPVTQKEYDEAKKALGLKEWKLSVSKWVETKDMTDDEKNNWTSHKQTGGFLKTIDYKDAWKEMWNGMSSDEKKIFTTLTNFDADIFQQITGINVKVQDSATQEAIKLLEKNGFKIVKE